MKILREADKTPVAEVAKKHGIAEQTIYVWRQRFGRLEAADVTRLRQLEHEHSRVKKAAFAHIQDNSGRIQIYLKRDVLGEKHNLLKKLDIGDIIGIKGRLFRTKTNELTVEVDNFSLLTKSIRPLPEKWHGLKDIETRYRQRYIDLIVNPEVRESFAKRSTIIRAVRDFLEARGFIEVETPMMHQIPGGATGKPFKTFHNALGIDLYLRIAPELYLKRLLVGAYERVYELNKNFRNEGISTKNNPEFSMLEFYIAYKDYNFLMSLTEELFSYAAMKAAGSLKIPYGDTEIDLTPPWPRVPMLEALEKNGVPSDIFSDAEKAKTWARANKIDIPNGSSMGKILDEIFKEKVEPLLIQPTFITDHPVELSPLAKRKGRDMAFKHIQTELKDGVAALFLRKNPGWQTLRSGSLDQAAGAWIALDGHRSGPA